MAPKTVSAKESLNLPKPMRHGDLSLEEALERRRSHRSFSGKPVVLDALSQLLWAAQGITDPEGYRTAPSAGALYPLELYVVTAAGAYHYEPRRHRLSVLAPGDLRDEIHHAALEQDVLLEAPVIFVIAGVYERTEGKYGGRAERYVHLEAGHAAQNLLLQAVSLDLAAVPIGAFEDAQIQKVLSLAVDARPLYLIPVGHPK